MSSSNWRRITAAAIGVACSVAAASPAAARDSDGPAWVDQLGSQLQPLRDAGPGDVALAKDSGLDVVDRAVAVDVPVTGDLDAAVAKLKAAGMDVVATGDDPRPTVEGYLPFDAISDVAKLGVSDAVIPVIGGGVDSTDAGGTDVGSVTSLGVTRHNIPDAIAAAGTSGAGVDVGVISDSINRVGAGVAGSQGSGDLPANTVVLKDGLSGDSDEGRAMAEIIFDEAPGLNKLMFASGTNSGPVDKADSINQLAANGADVIADDIFYLSEPFFQDGVVAQAVDAARAQNVAYFASAGNRARQSYESQYRDNGGGLHDFDPGAGTDTRSCFTGTVPNGGFILVALGWDEPVGNVTTDLDIRIVKPDGTILGSVGGDDNITTGDPKDIASWQNTSGGAQQACVEIQHFSGVTSPQMKWIEFDNFGPTPVPEFDTQSDTINPDAASAQGALTVAAVSQADPGLDTPESFSSRGPKTRFFDANGNRLATPLVLAKPNLAAADQVNTTVPGFAPFGGTSAATPSAAGIATILRSQNPNASVKEIYDTMTDSANAIDCTSSALVPDPDCGAGFILADRAVASLDTTGAEVSAATDPSKPNGKGGWFTKKSVGLSWSVTDSGSTIESSNGCDATTLKGDGTKNLTCNAVSGGGPGSGSITVKIDSTPPKKPKIKGFKGKGPLPPKKKIKCKSKDKTSGLAKCKISGYSTKPGKHKLKAVAIDKAGLKSKKKTIKYSN